MDDTIIEMPPLNVCMQEVERICHPDKILHEHLLKLTKNIQTRIRIFMGFVEIFRNMVWRSNEEKRERLDKLIFFFTILHKDLNKYYKNFTHLSISAELTFARMCENNPPREYPIYFLRVPDNADIEEFKITTLEVQDIINNVEACIRIINSDAYRDVHERSKEDCVRACIPLLHLRYYILVAYRLV